MNAPVTRRALLGATAVFGAVALPSAADATGSAMVSGDPDAGLLDLIAQHTEVVETRHAFWSVYEAAENRYRAAIPSLPATLDYRAGDPIHAMSGRRPGPRGGQIAFFTETDIEQLRSRGPVMVGRCDGSKLLRSEIDPTREARRQEIIAASDAWLAEKRAAEERSGFAAAEAEAEGLYEIAWVAREAVLDRVPASLHGFRAKARWAASLDDYDEACADQIVRDLAGMAGGADA